MEGHGRNRRVWGRTESSAPTPLCPPSPWGEGAERSEADEGAIFRIVIGRRPLIRHGLRPCHLPPKGKALVVFVSDCHSSGHWRLSPPGRGPPGRQGRGKVSSVGGGHDFVRRGGTLLRPSPGASLQRGRTAPATHREARAACGASALGVSRPPLRTVDDTIYHSTGRWWWPLPWRGPPSRRPLRWETWPFAIQPGAGDPCYPVTGAS